MARTTSNKTSFDEIQRTDGSIQNFLKRLEDAKRSAYLSGMPPHVIEEKANFDLEQYVRAHNAELRKAQEEKEPDWNANAATTAMYDPNQDPETVRRRKLLLLEA